MIQRVKVARASSLISGALLLSSVLGLLQTFLFTYVFGISYLGDAYLQAYIIPNLIYTVVAGGALSSAFIPVFTSYSVGRKDENSAWHIASSALNIAVVVMVLFSIVGFIAAPLLVPLYSAGDSQIEINLIVALTRIMLIQAIILGSGVIVGAVLNSKQDFTRTALGTVLYNVGLDIGLLPGFFMTFHSRTSTPSNFAVYSATFGVILAAALQVGVQIPGLSKVKMRYSLTFDWKHPGVRQIYKQMVPRAINALMLSFSTMVDRGLLSAIAHSQDTGFINEYFQAFSILLLPVSIFGSAVSTAAFPTLAGYVARGRFDRVRSIIMETLRGILFVTIPSAVGLIVLAFPIVQTLLEHGNFTLQGASQTAIPLVFFAIGLPALAAVEILTRSFYALQDSKTPVAISVAQFILKIAMSLILLNIIAFGIQGAMGALAFSTSVASILEAITLFIVLSQRIGGFDLKAFAAFCGRAFFACAVMAVALLLVRFGLDHVIDTTNTKQLFIPGIFAALVKLLIELGVGSAVFLVLARLMHMEEMNGGLVRRVINLLHIPWL
jgi:putative peptidoglycan lipid II flippase